MIRRHPFLAALALAAALVVHLQVTSHDLAGAIGRAAQAAIPPGVPCCISQPLPTNPWEAPRS
jgi:hypothetical protein